MNSLCRSEHVNATLRNRRVTDFRQIGRGNGKFLRQQWNDPPQHPRRLSMPVQQNQGQPGTSGELVPLHPIDFRVGRSDRRIRGLCGYRAHCDQNAKQGARGTPHRSYPAPGSRASRLAKVSSGLDAAAARLAAHRALIASASWARRSGERLSVLFFLPRFAARRAAAARAAAFLFAAASFAFISASSFRFNLASFLGPSRSRVSSRRIFFLRVLAFIKERIASPT